MSKNFIAMVFICSVIFVLSFGCDDSSTSEKPMEYKLATINAGGFVKDDDITVARFRSLLDVLSQKFVEDKQQIADMSVKMQNMLRDQGISESLLNIMEGMNKLFQGNYESAKYAEYISGYYTLRIQGESHQDAVEDLKAALQTMGIY